MQAANSKACFVRFLVTFLKRTLPRARLTPQRKIPVVHILTRARIFFLWVTNCKGPHTINTANAGSTRDLISQNKMCIKAIDCILIPREKRFETPTRQEQVSEFKLKYWTWYSERVILQFMCFGSLAVVTYLRYTVLTRPKRAETAVHCCDPALSVLVVLVSQNVFHIVSALQFIAFILSIKREFIYSLNIN